MGSLEAALRVEELRAAVEMQDQLARRLEERHRVQERALRDMGEGSRMVCMGNAVFVKMKSCSAKRFVQKEAETVWSDVEEAHLQLHRLEMQLEDAVHQLKEKEREEVQ